MVSGLRLKWLWKDLESLINLKSKACSCLTLSIRILREILLQNLANTLKADTRSFALKEIICPKSYTKRVKRLGFNCSAKRQLTIFLLKEITSDLNFQMDHQWKSITSLEPMALIRPSEQKCFNFLDNLKYSHIIASMHISGLL